MSQNDQTDLAAHYKAVRARLTAGRAPTPAQAPAPQPVKARPAPTARMSVPADVAKALKLPAVVLAKPGANRPEDEPDGPPLAKVRRIVVPVLKAHGVTWDQIIDRRRPRNLIPARLAVYAALHNAGYSLASIGRFCKRDHTTVLYYLCKWGGYKRASRPDPYKVTL